MYRVRLTREWSATLDTLVWATSKEAAIEAAKDEEHLDAMDAHDDGLDSWADMLNKNLDEIKLLLEEDSDLEDEIVVADPMAHSQLMSFSEFMLQVDPEYIKLLRAQAIEKDNGQLDLLSQPQP